MPAPHRRTIGMCHITVVADRHRRDRVVMALVRVTSGKHKGQWAQHTRTLLRGEKVAPVFKEMVDEAENKARTALYCGGTGGEHGGVLFGTKRKRRK